MKNIIISTLLVLFSSSSFAWKVEVETDFKGNKQTYWTAKTANGGVIYVDLQKEWVVYAHRNKVLEHIDGIKIDGEFIHATGRTSVHNHFESIVFCRKSEPCYEPILNGKKVEVNIQYYRQGYQAQTFVVNK